MVGYIGVLVTIGALFVVRAAMVSGRELQTWAGSRGLRLDDENLPLVRWYLRTARTLRTLGVVAGLVLPPLAVTALGRLSPSAGGWLGLFIGYLLGAVGAEVALGRRPPGRAAITPRQLGAYLPDRIRHAQRSLGAVLAVTAAGSWVLLERRDPDHVTGWLAVAAVVGALSPLVLEGVQRWLVTRPQPITSPSLLAADDAIRVQSVHSVAGAGLALQLVVLGMVAAWLAQSDLPTVRQLTTVPALVLPVLGALACLYYGHRAWGVRRPVARAEGQPAC